MTIVIRPISLSVLLALTNAQHTMADEPMPKSSAELEMKMMDVDRNGRISATEHTAGAKKMFETMDRNKDGTVTPGEMDTSERSMMGAHRPKEALSAADKIKVIDTDQDGELSADEHFAGSRQMFNRMDTNGDRTLTLEEIQAGHAEMLNKTADASRTDSNLR